MEQAGIPDGAIAFFRPCWAPSRANAIVLLEHRICDNMARWAVKIVSRRRRPVSRFDPGTLYNAKILAHSANPDFAAFELRQDENYYCVAEHIRTWNGCGEFVSTLEACE
jgi:hypothetical protein